MREAVDAQDKDWPKFTRQAIDFHCKNADAWANAATGQELKAQVDDGFTLGPQALTTAAG
jgi:CO dehydrogenase maturation factor